MKSPEEMTEHEFGAAVEYEMGRQDMLQEVLSLLRSEECAEEMNTGEPQQYIADFLESKLQAKG